MNNTGKLAGRTLFISGASRGIGKAIALKAARDGANVVLAAKTAEPHPKLPGTIYTAAKEVEDAGGKSLPCTVDIRDEGQVERAVKQAVEKFGGIDILVNNASAISLTGTLATRLKTYDLMMGVNGRGTYLCSQKVIPYLKKSPHAHILNISPPLNMKPIWFKNHCAYTMAKYAMSMCVLGMSEELKDDGIAVNALWPKTAIHTAAMEMLGGGDGIAHQCRKVDIVADSAYAILLKDKSYTGQFLIDEEVLKGEGITDMEQYACHPGNKLMPDFFLDEFLESEMAAAGQQQGAGSSGDSSQQVAAVFKSIGGFLGEDLTKSVAASFTFDVQGDIWHLDLKSGSGSVGQGAHPGGATDVTMTMDQATFVDVFTGKLNSVTAFMGGKMKIKGNMAAAMKLEKLMKKVQSKL